MDARIYIEKKLVCYGRFPLRFCTSISATTSRKTISGQLSEITLVTTCQEKTAEKDALSHKIPWFHYPYAPCMEYLPTFTP
jgi:hypothetical protein